MARASRQTRQKQRLRDAMTSMKGFFSADELSAAVDDASIGIATVYRFLKQMVNDGELYAYRCGGRSVYSTSQRNHCHFICERCGTVSHFSVENLDFLPMDTSSVSSVQLEVTGVCELCR